MRKRFERLLATVIMCCCIPNAAMGKSITEQNVYTLWSTCYSNYGSGAAIYYEQGYYSVALSVHFTYYLNGKEMITPLASALTNEPNTKISANMVTVPGNLVPNHATSFLYKNNSFVTSFSSYIIE